VWFLSTTAACPSLCTQPRVGCNPPPSQDPTTLQYGCGVATIAQVNKVSSDLAALEPKLNAVAAQASSAQATLVGGNNQTAVLRAEVNALLAALAALTAKSRDEIAALTAQVQQLKANATNGTDPAIAQQIAVLAAADTRTAQKLALLDAADQTTAQGIASLNATLAATKSAQEANAAAISLANATVESVKSSVTAGAAAVMLVNASLTALAATVANVSAIDFSVYAKSTDLANLDAVALGGIPAAQYQRMKVVLYRESDTGRDGNLGGRSGADTLCRASANRPTGLPQARAFISISSGAQISDFPTLYGVPNAVPVESVTGAVLASSFKTLLGGRIQRSLSDAGVLTGLVNWWSGSDAAGRAVPLTCSGFTSNAATGNVGLSTVTDASWIELTDFCSRTNKRLVCVAFG
jgi:hypothetical protein